MPTLTIYHGGKPIRAQGVNQCHLLRFAYEYRGWHSYKKNCRATKEAIKGLIRRGCIETNAHGQFRFKYPK